MKQGYTTYKVVEGINLIKNGFQSYSVKGNTALGKLIKQTQKEMPGHVVWYDVLDASKGKVAIVIKRVA